MRTDRHDKANSRFPQFRESLKIHHPTAVINRQCVRGKKEEEACYKLKQQIKKRLSIMQNIGKQNMKNIKLNEEDSL